jgi:m7GpppX diphosphatase
MFAPSPSAGKSFNWLAIVTDPSLRSVRDLRGEHVPMLEQMYEQCIGVIHNEFGVSRQDVMAFANYPPSVYRLHIHFCAPFFLSSAYDAFRMHSLSGIINNLKINGDYYKLSTFYIPVHCGSDLHKVWEDGDGNKSGAQENIA